jgi:hypothetical protein
MLLFYSGTLYTLFCTAYKRRALKVFFRVDLIFEVEKLKIFQLQKLNQPISPSLHQQAFFFPHGHTPFVFLK